jgi:hypothetical protein
MEYSRAGIWEYYTWDENATSATKLYVTVQPVVATVGRLVKNKKRKKKSYRGVTEGSGGVTWS